MFPWKKKQILEVEVEGGKSKYQCNLCSFAVPKNNYYVLSRVKKHLENCHMEDYLKSTIEEEQRPQKQKTDNRQQPSLSMSTRRENSDDDFL